MFASHANTVVSTSAEQQSVLGFWVVTDRVHQADIRLLINQISDRYCRPPTDEMDVRIHFTQQLQT